jgi:hypothetical protein
MPARIAPALNDVFRAWDAKEAVSMVGGDVAPARQHLEATQKAYTKEVVALLRAGVKQGLHHRPASEEVQLLLFQEMQGIRQVLTGILDMMTFRVCCFLNTKSINAMGGPTWKIVYRLRLAMSPGCAVFQSNAFNNIMMAGVWSWSKTIEDCFYWAVRLRTGLRRRRNGA